MRRQEERRALSRKAGHHVALGVEHQEAIVAADGFDDQMQHGLRLAAADAAKNQEMSCLAVATERDRRQQLDAMPVNPALAGAGPREGFQPCRACLQPRAARDLEGRLIDAKAESEAEQRQEADHGPTGDGQAPKIEGIKRAVPSELMLACVPVIPGSAIAEERACPRLEASLPIRLLPTPPTCRMLPGSGVKLCVGKVR